jgi:hypothetical protein
MGVVVGKVVEISLLRPILRDHGVRLWVWSVRGFGRVEEWL